MNIRFPVYGKEKVFPTRDVLSIGFTDTAVDASSSEAPPVAGAASIDAPRVDLSDPPPTAPAAQQNAQSIPSTTIPSGTSVLIRMIDSVDSSKNAVGDSFHARLESTLTVGDTEVAAKDADAYGKLAQAKSPGKISSSAELTSS
jgi:hypothetical protein